MEFLQNLLENSQFPLLTAFILGLMTAISPCPLATNITAIGFIGKDLGSKKKIFLNGIYYTLGRTISYTTIGLLFYFGVGQFEISSVLQDYGEKFLGPILIIISLFMLGVFKFNFSSSGKMNAKLEKISKKGFWGATLLGIFFALAFCPYSGVLYFGMLIPLTVSQPSGLILPIVFAIATGIPVILFAWLIAYSVSSMGNVYTKIKLAENWIRKGVAILFLIVGLYYIYSVYIANLF